MPSTSCSISKSPGAPKPQDMDGLLGLDPWTTPAMTEGGRSVRAAVAIQQTGRKNVAPRLKAKPARLPVMVGEGRPSTSVGLTTVLAVEMMQDVDGLLGLDPRTTPARTKEERSACAAVSALHNPVSTA